MKQLALLLILVFVTNFATAATHTNFLPMEDSFYSFRENEVVYGANVTTIKPYRSIVAVDDQSRLSGEFMDSTDILICILLFGVYFAFTHKRSQTRNIDL